jgi:hypothetical protein
MQGDGSLVLDASLVMPARFQDQAARSYVPSHQRFGSEQDVAYEALQLTTPPTFQSQVARPNASRHQVPMGSEHGVRHSLLPIALTDECLRQHRDSDCKEMSA